MPLRVAFFGTPGFAVPTLEHLVNSPHEVVGVITQPDKPRGRGQQVADGPVKSLAATLRLPVLQPAKLARDLFESQFAALNADIGVVAAYGKILPDWLLATPRLGLINVHASLLPRYRGASPVHRAVINGDAETGVTIMRVVKELDAGPMLAAARVPIAIDDTTTIVESALAIRGAELLVSTLDAIEAGTARETPQDPALVTYAPKLAKTEGLARLDVERRQDPQPRSRPVALAACVHVSRRDALHRPPFATVHADRQKLPRPGPSSMPRRWKGCTSPAAKAPRSSSSTSNSKANG